MAEFSTNQHIPDPDICKLLYPFISYDNGKRGLGKLVNFRKGWNKYFLTTGLLCLVSTAFILKFKLSTNIKAAELDE